MTESASRRPRLVLGDDGEQPSDVAWRWVTNQEWPGWYVDVLTADTRDGVTLVRQLSDSRCIQGQTWGWDARGVWVDRGCRGEFRSGGGRYGNEYGGGYPGYGSGARSVRCESTDKRLRRCDMTIRGARLQRQLSDARCIEGRSWGWDRRGIWVSGACRAEFAVW